MESFARRESKSKLESKIKVAHIITQLELGGAQQNTLYTVSHLGEDQFQTVLISGPGGILDPEARKLSQQGIQVHFVESLVRPISPSADLRALWALYHLLKKEKPHIVHTHSSKAGILGRWAAYWAGVPILIHTFHGLGFHEGQKWPYRFLLAFIERISAKISSKLIAVSRANQSYGLKYQIGKPYQYELIRSGVDLSRFPSPVNRMQKRLELGIQQHKPLVISIGNFKPQKNPLDFVQMAKHVLKQVPQARFLFVGDGELRPKVEAALLKEGIWDKVLLAGWRKDTAEILSTSDLFVMTSLWEGLPRSLVEAMASGLPVAAYDVDGIRDILHDGENGFLVTPKDVEALSQRVIQLLKDESLRQRLGSAARISIGKEFDINTMVRQQEELYKSCLGNKF